MDHKIPGKYYLVEVTGWNKAGFAVAEYQEFPGGPEWRDIGEDMECTAHVKSYKSLDKVGKMHPFSVLIVKNT
jgi:hypothetical protein